MKNYIARTGTAAFVALTVVSLQAVPVQFGLNHYEFILVPDPFGNAGANNSWFAADAAAAASAFNSVNGHLATISSQAENDFLLSLVPVGLFTGFAGAWIGGDAAGWLRGPEAGQAFTFTKWAGGEPNNNGYAYMSIGGGFGAGGFWADDSFSQGYPDPSADPVVGYFIEYEAAASAVPDGGTTFGLFSLALAALAWSRRKRSPA